jgi:hypothetical protein
MNASDVAYALDLDLEAISKRLHDPDGPHLQDVETILYALHSLREYTDPPAMHPYVTAVQFDQDRETFR